MTIQARQYLKANDDAPTWFRVTILMMIMIGWNDQNDGLWSKHTQSDNKPTRDTPANEDSGRYSENTLGGKATHNKSSTQRKER